MERSSFTWWQCGGLCLILVRCVQTMADMSKIEIKLYRFIPIAYTNFPTGMLAWDHSFCRPSFPIRPGKEQMDACGPSCWQHVATVHGLSLKAWRFCLECIKVFTRGLTWLPRYCAVCASEKWFFRPRFPQFCTLLRWNLQPFPATMTQTCQNSIQFKRFKRFAVLGRRICQAPAPCMKCR